MKSGEGFQGTVLVVLLCSAQQRQQPQMPGLHADSVTVLTLTVTAQVQARELKASLKESPFRENVSVYIALSL